MTLRTLQLRSSAIRGEAGRAYVRQRRVMPADRSVVYQRTPVLLDCGYAGKARLFVSDDGQVAAVDDSYVQLLELFTLHGGPPTSDAGDGPNAGTLTCRSTLVEVQRVASGTGEEVRVLVGPMRLSVEMARKLVLCASTILSPVPAEETSCRCRMSQSDNLDLILWLIGEDANTND